MHCVKSCIIFDLSIMNKTLKTSIMHYLQDEKVKQTFGVWQAALKCKYASKETLQKLKDAYTEALNEAKNKHAKR